MVLRTGLVACTRKAPRPRWGRGTLAVLKKLSEGGRRARGGLRVNAGRPTLRGGDPSVRGTRQAATDPERRRPWRRLRGADRRAGGPQWVPGTGQQADSRGKGPPPSFTALPTSLASSSGDNAVGGSGVDGGGFVDFEHGKKSAETPLGLPPTVSSIFKRPDLAPVVTGGSSTFSPPHEARGVGVFRPQNTPRHSNS